MADIGNYNYTMKKKIANSTLIDIQEFSHNLQKAVLATGLTPYTLAKKIGVNKDAIKNLTKGDRDPQFSTAISIVKGMQLSMDELLGIISGNTSIQSPPTPKIEIKKGNINFIEKITRMNEQDVELLEAIAGVLDDRRVRAVTRLLHAVQGAELPNENEKEGFMAKAEKIKNPKVTKPLSDFDDDFEDDEYEEDEDFEVDDDFDEDKDFEDDDDFDFEDDD
jgi:DNA-binding XRE family transcriptional regulator